MGIEFVLWILLLAVGMVLLIKGADWFVEGASSIAKSLKIPSLIIGLTLVSIGTSMPEFSVSLTSSIKGFNDISFGNIIGSNIFNTFAVIGISAIITPLAVSKNMKKYDLPILIFIYTLLTLFAFVITPNIINIYESIIIFVLTFIYTAFLILRTKKENKGLMNEVETVDNNKKQRKLWVNILFVIIGLACIILGGDLVVDYASKIAKALNMSDLLIGLTIVAVGTSLPELVTSLVAAKKGENDIAIGNAIGSCIFNVILILGLCSTIEPTIVAMSSLVDVIFMILSAVLVLIFSLISKKITRWQGVVLTLIYVVYIVFIIYRNMTIA